MEGDAHVTIPKPTFDRTITFGNVLQSFLILAAMLSFFAVQVQWRTAVDLQLQNTAETLRQMAKDRTSDTDKMVGVEANDKLQDQRIVDLKGDLQDIQKTQDRTNETLGKTNEVLSKITTSIAVIEERTKKETPN